MTPSDRPERDAIRSILGQRYAECDLV